MSRRLRSPTLETHTARARLEVRRKPYFVSVAPGIALGYRRCKSAGRWVLRCAGSGSEWTKVIALADDYEDANGVSVLDFWTAQIRTRELARLGKGVEGDLILEQQIARKALAFLEQGTEPGCYLYRHFHPNGDLLYVGISLAPLQRQQSHMQAATWRDMICRILIEPFETREQALAAEEAAIRNEFPKFNSRHNARRHPFQELARASNPEAAP